MEILYLSIIVIFIIFVIVKLLINKNNKKKSETPKISSNQKPDISSNQEPEISTEIPTKPSLSTENNNNIFPTENYFEEALNEFNKVIPIKTGSKTSSYLGRLYSEALQQYFANRSVNNIPILFKFENFPNIYNFYGNDGDEISAFKTLVGWIFAMQLSEIRPDLRTTFFKIGYEFGGYTKDSNIYGYKFKCDPNICRLVGSAIYSAIRKIANPDIKSMQKELNSDYLYPLVYEFREFVDGFDLNYYVDLRKFMPTAPGPYAPGYKDRSSIGGYPYPNEEKTKDNNLLIDKQIRDYIIKEYNLNYRYPNSSKSMDTVQAIADKDANYNHLFGRDRQVDEFIFSSVFNANILNKEINPNLAKELCELVEDVLYIGSSQRCILQGHENQIYPPQYGRLRPGCSWEKEAVRHSHTNDEENVLVDFDLEENDGNPTGYYNENNKWVYKNGIHSPEEYNDVMKDELWANSYPSGHSAGIWSVALLLIELFPERSDKIMMAANKFAVNRTIARYHWNSDTIQGRVLASCAAPLIRNCSDWSNRLEEAKNCL